MSERIYTDKEIELLQMINNKIEMDATYEEILDGLKEAYESGIAKVWDDLIEQADNKLREICHRHDKKQEPNI